jgi:glycosyltransferase involved in cell wall biosynthesis
LRIVYAFDNRVPSPQADTEQLINNVAALSRRGLPVTLLLPRLGADCNAEDIRRFYKVEGSFGVAHFPGPRRPRVVQKLWSAVAVALHTEPPGVLLWTRNLPIALGALARGHMVVYETYRPWPDQYSVLRPLLRHMFRSQRLLGAILHSELARQSFLGLGVSEDKLLVAHNGFDPRRLEPALDLATARGKLGLPLDRPIAVYTGRVDAKKGLDPVLEMARRCPEVLFLLVGAKRPDAFTERAREIENVRLIPWQSYEHVSDWLYAADVLLIPPSPDPLQRRGHTVLPMKLFSYLAVGRPILAQGTEDVCEILRDGDNARLVPPGDLDATVEALRELVEDPALRMRLSCSASRASKAYSWDARAERIHRFLSTRHPKLEIEPSSVVEDSPRPGGAQ